MREYQINLVLISGRIRKWTDRWNCGLCIYFGFISVYMLTYVHSEICGQEELVQCSRQIQVLTETSEFNFVDNKEELDRVCP
jgi:hypothetical protein